MKKAAINIEDSSTRLANGMNTQFCRKRRRTLVTACFATLSFTATTPFSNAYQPTSLLHSPLSKLTFSQKLLPKQLITSRPMSGRLYMSYEPSRLMINVAIDRPILDDSLLLTMSRRPIPIYKKVGLILFKPFALLFSNNLSRLALAAFLISLLVTLQLKSGPIFSRYFSSVSRKVKGSCQRLLDAARRKRQGTPMPFDQNVNDGWGVCTLQQQKKLGKSKFVEYSFTLPKSSYTLPLELGQTLAMMYLDSENNVVKGEVFPFYADPYVTGTFSLLLPGPTSSHESNVLTLGPETAALVRSLQREMRVGDEIAIQPGTNRLMYKGQFLPVNNMVYIACGLGIVPVLDQVRAVLPSGSSSVEFVTVVWINEETKDFDVTSDLLENEYFKYSSKLSVSCIVDNMRRKPFEENDEVRAAVPPFRPGTMAVLAGPLEIMRKAVSYLELELGYPRDTICIM